MKRTLRPRRGRCAASTTLGNHTWRCADRVGHDGNHHATTTAGAKIVWPQRPADVLMAAHLAKLAAAERRSAEYVEYNNHAQHYADAEARRAASCIACRNGDHINCPAHSCACQRAGHV